MPVLTTSDSLSYYDRYTHARYVPYRKSCQRLSEHLVWEGLCRIGRVAESAAAARGWSDRNGTFHHGEPGGRRQLLKILRYDRWALIGSCGAKNIYCRTGEHDVT
jgi:hypothetical protein